ncbi:hypothetical protein TIFTF001_001611 [Ficus carica]|uniref:Uncharacterized protein n=1 Tax=Ficus carica TaxID=3494 RepID=A0AA87ZNW6_FICCA|nr:hypothetical protein TIFTF001_001611 [Ficus carica]
MLIASWGVGEWGRRRGGSSLPGGVAGSRGRLVRCCRELWVAVVGDELGSVVVVHRRGCSHRAPSAASNRALSAASSRALIAIRAVDPPPRWSSRQIVVLVNTVNWGGGNRDGRHLSLWATERERRWRIGVGNDSGVSRRRDCRAGGLPELRASATVGG